MERIQAQHYLTNFAADGRELIVMYLMSRSAVVQQLNSRVRQTNIQIPV
jgi:hypothetical protein